jgi:hypothetical protein
MKRGVDGKKVVTGVMTAIAVGMVLAVVVAVLLRRMVMTTPAPVPSPDGQLTASLTVTDSRGDPATHMKLALSIRNRTGDLLLHDQTPASAMRAYELKWQDNAHLTLESAEVGKLLYVQTDQGWKRE